MKKSAVSFLVLVFVLLACQKKSIPVITARTSEPPPPQKKLVDVQPDMVLGKTIFTNRCGRCHDLPTPDQYTAQRWEGILSYMIPKARLTEEQGIHVKAYLRENAAK